MSIDSKKFWISKMAYFSPNLNWIGNKLKRKMAFPAQNFSE